MLTRTPATLHLLLRGLPGIWVHSNEGKILGAHSTVMGHLVYGERSDWMARLRTLPEKGEVLGLR